tara:strand:- start:2162 stop:2374 length:213 start_codon:yes stop_codon:yes gene_type:complete
MEDKIIKELTKISTIQEITSEDIKDIKSMLKEQNGRVRTNENSIARLNTIAGLSLTGLVSYLAWLLGFKQ